MTRVYLMIGVWLAGWCHRHSDPNPAHMQN